MPEFSTDIALMPGNRILIVHFSGYLIYSVPKKEVTTYISWEFGRIPMPSLPFQEGNKLYLIPSEGAVLCLQLPK